MADRNSEEHLEEIQEDIDRQRRKLNEEEEPNYSFSETGDERGPVDDNIAPPG